MATRCGTELVVVNIMEPGQDQSEVLARARSYLEKQGTQAFYAERDGVIAEEILKTSQAHECDLIIMGGYGFDPLMEIVLGSAVDEVLRTSRLPMLICR
jgi:nucleotide-binding universal stress UspA family protein